MKKIVIIEDDKILREELEILLNDSGYQAEILSDFTDAAAQVRQIRPDLVLLDIILPGANGQYILRQIREKSDVPVIMLTSKDGEVEEIMSRSSGADDYVTKPFNVEILILRMRKLIDLSKKRKAKSLIDPEPSEIAITSLDEKLVENAIKYVEANIGRCDLSVEELSRGLGMSRVHLYKKLLQITGKTPIEFIRVIRLKRAAQMLRESQQNVSEIAYQLGFNNPKYFSKYFKDEFGVLPSVYQEREGR